MENGRFRWRPRSIGRKATSQDIASTAATVDKARVKRFAPVYTVSEYDPERKAVEDLAATIKRAKADRKRIILEVGGNW